MERVGHYKSAVQGHLLITHIQHLNHPPLQRPKLVLREMIYSSVLAIVAVLSYCGASPISSWSNGTDLEDRGIQPPCIVNQYLATRIDDNTPGDGDPHQNYYHIQLSSNINCEGGGCQTSQSNTDSKTIGFTIGTNSNAKKLGWFQGGFSVSESWTTGNAYTCDGTAGEIVCVWQNVAHTAVSQALFVG